MFQAQFDIIRYNLIQFNSTFGPGVPRADRQYTGSHSPHRCDVLPSPANHRAASQVVASHKWRDFPSTQTAYNKRVKTENWNCDRDWLLLKNPAGRIPNLHLTTETYRVSDSISRFGLRKWIYLPFLLLHTIVIVL